MSELGVFNQSQPTREYGKTLFESSNDIIYSISEYGMCCCPTKAQDFKVGSAKFQVFDKFVLSSLTTNTVEFGSAWVNANSGGCCATIFQCCQKKNATIVLDEAQFYAIKKEDIIMLTSAKVDTGIVANDVTKCCQCENCLLLCCGLCGVCCSSCYVHPTMTQTFSGQPRAPLAMTLRTKVKLLFFFKTRNFYSRT